jgi:hypothetical protein
MPMQKTSKYPVAAGGAWCVWWSVAVAVAAG